MLKLEKPDEAYFWATHQGAEIDLLLLKNRRKIGVEIKYTDAPTMTPSTGNRPSLFSVARSNG